MNPEEKRCVRLLGFPPEDFRMDGTTDGQHGVDKTWDAMSDDERQCARLLGWDAAKWHRHDRVPQVTLWAELSDDERHAAVFLVREPWRCVAYACGPIFSRLYKRPALASSHTPAPLTADGRVCVCAGACCCKPCPWQGFTDADFGLKLGCDKHWADMSKQEQRAVVELGWNSRSWDAGEDHAHNQQLLTRKSTSLAIHLHLQFGTNR